MCVCISVSKSIAVEAYVCFDDPEKWCNAFGCAQSGIRLKSANKYFLLFSEGYWVGFT